jgi:hypothetical protein
MKLKQYFQSKGLSFWFLLASLVLVILGFVLYLVTVQQMAGKIQVLDLLFPIIGLALIAVACFYRSFDGILTVFACSLCFLSALLFLSAQFGNLGYYFAGIKDIGFGIMPCFVIGFIFYLSASVLCGIAAFIKDKKGQNI